MAFSELNVKAGMSGVFIVMQMRHPAGILMGSDVQCLAELGLFPSYGKSNALLKEGPQHIHCAENLPQAS